MSLNTREMTGLSKDIIYSQKLRKRKKKGTFASICSLRKRTWEIKSPESWHEIKVQQATSPINEKFLW